jgi:transglutaminase-like putative cysteine protease
MIAAATAASLTLPIRNLAEAIVADIPNKDYAGEIAAIQKYVRDNIRYTRDPVTTETLKTPEELLISRQGDCDDQATLVAAIAMTIGFPVRFIAIGYIPGEYEHVYAEVKLGTLWLSVETTEPVSIGWKPAKPLMYMERHA